MKKDKTIYDFINLLEEGYQQVIESDFEKPNLTTLIELQGKELEFHFNFYSEEDFNSHLYNLNIEVKFKDTGHLLCEMEIIIILSFCYNVWDDIQEDCIDYSRHLVDTFEKIFYRDDDEFEEDDNEPIQNYDEYLDLNETPIWINLNHLLITEDYRGQGYGQEIIKYIINLLGLDTSNDIDDNYTSNDIVFSVYPYPIEDYPSKKELPIEDFELKQKMVQNFYKKIGFNDFYDRGIYICELPLA